MVGAIVACWTLCKSLSHPLYPLQGLGQVLAHLQRNQYDSACPFLGAGICFEEGENQEQIKYQAAHHELVASAMATKIAHEIDPENKVGCMLAAGQYYPNTAHPRDYWAAMEEDRKSYFFIDVQARGNTQIMPRSSGEREGIEIEMTTEDLDLLKNHTVDFVSFSYYASRVASGDPEVRNLTSGNVFASIKNPYLESSEWGWQIDPLGLRITSKYHLGSLSKAYVHRRKWTRCYGHAG